MEDFLPQPKELCITTLIPLEKLYKLNYQCTTLHFKASDHWLTIIIIIIIIIIIG